jgi:spore maturation protein CgeB
MAQDDPATLDLDAALEGADLVLVHEWNEPDLVTRVGAHRARGGTYCLLFHDTHHRAITEPGAVARLNLGAYDGVLAFGRVLRDLYLANGWARRAWTWHEAADTRMFAPARARAVNLAGNGSLGFPARADHVSYLGRPGLPVRGPRHGPPARETPGLESGERVNYQGSPGIHAGERVTARQARTSSPPGPMVAQTPEGGGDLVWVGNWGDGERSAELREYLLEPVRRLGLSATVYGVRYPATARRTLARARIRHGGWLPNHLVPWVFARFAATVHVPRRPYARMLPGIPTIRVFEALACGIPLVCAPWDDAEGLFRPGQDYLVARSGEEMAGHLRAILHDPSLASSLAAHGRETILARHTCKHRVDELLAIAAECRA